MIDVDGEYNLEKFNKFEDSGDVRTTIADQTTRTIILPLVDKNIISLRVVADGHVVQ